MPLDLTDLPALADAYAAKSPQDILATALQEFSPQVGIAFSGAEDVVLIDMAVKLGVPFTVFSLDTGRLHPETYQFIEKVRTHYGIPIETVLPQSEAVQKLVREKGLFSFYQDGHTECCNIRKVEPLNRALEGKRAWVTGVRRADGPTRANTPIVSYDINRNLVKINPLAAWTDDDMSLYAEINDLPANPLTERGYPSIGCWPCTRPVAEGEDRRGGRWAGNAKTECGLHV